MYSPEFRRLSGVTQVVPPQVDYQFHDRLSHSVKVARVASTLARQLVHVARRDKRIPEEIRKNLGQWVDPDHCYVAGIAHDIGHPPFGHAGEVALRDYCESVAIEYENDDTGDGDEGPVRDDLIELRSRSFEGNAQSTRVVAELSFRRDELYPGLNLTKRSLAAIAKYPWVRGQHPHRIEKLSDKWSFYEEERGILDVLVEEGFILPVLDGDHVEEVYRWVEAEIMDWADDISYSVHDLDDFYRAGLIPLHQIAAALHLASPRENWESTSFGFVHNEDINNCLVYVHKKLRSFAATHYGEESAGEILGQAFSKISHLVNEMPTAPFSGSRKSHAQLQDFGSALIKYLSGAATLQYNTETRRVQLGILPEAVLVAEFFKALNKIYVIDSAMLASAQYGQNADITTLCDSLLYLAVEWLGKPEERSINRRLPPRLREYLKDAIEDEEKSDDYSYVLVRVVDYVCSLSDFQATLLADHLKGSSSMGVLDGRWLDS